MKVLKYGEGYPKRIFCDKCESTLEYDIKDIENKIKRIYNPDSYTDYIDYIERTLICPVCNNYIIFDSRIHKIVLKETPKKKWWQK